jgi:predicted helicase
MPHSGAYLQHIARDLAAGHATEHTHRPALKTYLESFGKDIEATNEPKHEKFGAPDFIVTRRNIPQGYVEAKDVGVGLDKVEKSEQLERYRTHLNNLVLTNYLEFRWYVDGELRMTARLGKTKGKSEIQVEPDGEREVEALLTQFLDYNEKIIGSPKDLAERMAKLAQVIRMLIGRAVASEETSGKLHQQLQGFREVLIHDLDAERFADMYAQTICYGLFAARCNARGGERFTRKNAAHDLPKTNPFLRKLFQHVAGPDLDDEPHAWAVDDLAELLHRADIGAILADFGRRTRREDPVVHFYETFLAAYDPKMREARGVYYTPEPVVSYIVRSVDHILKHDFKLAEGLADASRIKTKTLDGKGETDVHRVLILDPATGTGTFLYSVINHIYESFRQNRGMWSSYVSEHLLPRLFGFELLMAPYAVAHTKLDLQLKELGYDFKADERLRVYLTNTLEEAHEISNLPLFAAEIAREANEASQIKKEKPVMVVLGNPPYSGHSENRGVWIKNLIDDYKTGCPELKKPAQAKWLSDDYVKFIRFAQWRIEQTGYGILAFISNHGYLNNPTFRCMRQSLLSTFDDIYMLDLHGNIKKKERAPDGSKDENVFDIQQGVAIGIFIKRSRVKNKDANIRHAHLWGVREIYGENSQGERVLTGGKYLWLSNNEIKTTEWKELKPEAPYYLFVPRDTSLLPEYETGWSVAKIFSPNGDPAPGIVTTHDEFAISWSADEAVNKVEQLLETSTEREARDIFRLCTQDQWNYERAKEELSDEEWRNELTPILYRPFDMRWTVFNRNVAVHRRERVMKQMLAGNNIGLCTNRQVNGDFQHVLCTNTIINDCTLSLATKERTYLLPLYLYYREGNASLLDIAESVDDNNRRPNLAPDFIADFSGRLGLTFITDGEGDLVETFGPEDVFAYMYTVFHSPTYRSRYAEFLKIDFPRLPLTRNPALFRALCTLGARLVRLHLLAETAPTVASYPVPGDDTVEFVRFETDANAATGRVHINRTQYFDGVPTAVWHFHVGGYQVAHKWLKDRKGRILTFDEQRHYLHTLAALNETIRLMREIDETITAHGGWPVQ